MTIVIRCGRLVDVKNGCMTEKAVLVVEGSRLVAAGKESEIDVPSGGDVQELDCSEKTVLPGLIDTHLHFALGAGANYEEMFTWPDSLQLVTGILNARLTLESGVTTARDCGARNRVALDLREAGRRGLIVSPRLLVCGRSITATGGHFHFCNAVADGYQEVRKATRQLLKEGVDFIKIMTSGGATRGTQRQRPSYTSEEIRGATEETDQQGKTVTAHCHATQSVANAVEAGVDVIEHCTFIEADGDGIRHVFREDIARDMVRKDIVADNVVIAMNDRDRLEWCFQNFRGLRRLGAKIVAGTDGLGLYKTAGLPVVLEMMVRAGDEPMDAIRAATTMAAEVCGLETVGSLEVGKEADLIVVEGDPLDNIRVLRSPSLVMKGGVIIARTKIVKEYRREYNSVFEEYDKILNLWNEVAATY